MCALTCTTNTADSNRHRFQDPGQFSRPQASNPGAVADSAGGVRWTSRRHQPSRHRPCSARDKDERLRSKHSSAAGRTAALVRPWLPSVSRGCRSRLSVVRRSIDTGVKQPAPESGTVGAVTGRRERGRRRAGAAGAGAGLASAGRVRGVADPKCRCVGQVDRGGCLSPRQCPAAPCQARLFMLLSVGGSARSGGEGARPPCRDARGFVWSTSSHHARRADG